MWQEGIDRCREGRRKRQWKGWREVQVRDNHLPPQL